ncbi:MAG: hypothetical protein ABIE03_06335 [Patescibacteria group bacterium]|nr:hypothetical protein [Patescibacteria group bacterium]
MSDKVKNTILGLRIYNGCMSVLFAIVLVSFCALPFIFADQSNEIEAPAVLLIGGLVFVFLFILLFFVAHLIGALKAQVQKRWVWILQIILMGMGLGSVFSLIPCIILMINLLSDEVQEHYKGPETSGS